MKRMKTYRLGQTDIYIPNLCVGCWQLSPKYWGEIDLSDWNAAMQTAHDAGLRFVDTADAYGDGYAEESLGNYFKSTNSRKDWILATKFYWDFTTSLPEYMGASRFPNTARDYILKECEASLKRLQTDYIDLYQLHAWDPLIHPEEVADAIETLRKQGKIRAFGVSNLNASQIRMLGKFTRIDSLQPCYNLLQREREEEEFPLCLEQQISVLAYSPLARGALTGKYSNTPPKNDHRQELPYFAPAYQQKLQTAFKTLEPMIQELGLTIPQFVIRWLLTHPALTSAIIGTKTPDHITTILPAAEATLTSQQWHFTANTISKALR